MILRGPFLVTTCLLSFGSYANEDYSAGSHYAQSLKGQGTSAINGLNPVEALPNFNPNPPEASRYGGVAGTSNNMDNDGNRALQVSEAGKTITDSILNKPKEPVSLDAPFIAAGLNAQDNAGSATHGSFEGCEASRKEQIIITSHVCERDVNATQICKRTSSISGQWKTTTEYRSVTIVGQDQDFNLSGDSYSTNVNMPAGQVIDAALNYSWNKRLAFGNDRWVVAVNTLGGRVVMNDETGSGNFPVGQRFEENAKLTINLGDRRLNSGLQASFLWLQPNMRYAFTLILTMAVSVKKWVPEVIWGQPCALSQEYGVSLIGSLCSVEGSSRDVVKDGINFSVYSDCWEYTETYRTQQSNEGTCGAYVLNPSCTLAVKACSFSDNGLCLHENVTYTCETKVESEGMLCGGQFFCTDGSCAQTEAGKSNSFSKALSQLAAVLAAGEDVAKMNDLNVKAFTGQGQSCRKATAGFNDCCKSGGWGSDTGLAHCSSEEKALGEARERNLTVEVGEYCARKVLGVCLLKKRGFCVFDSKLAQIVQQQGRQWQLGVGFGSGDNPNCRAITVEELQGIDFSRLDFKSFYEDLENGTDIPSDHALIEKARELIKGRQREDGR